MSLLSEGPLQVGWKYGTTVVVTIIEVYRRTYINKDVSPWLLRFLFFFFAQKTVAKLGSCLHGPAENTEPRHKSHALVFCLCTTRIVGGPISAKPHLSKKKRRVTKGGIFPPLPSSRQPFCIPPIRFDFLNSFGADDFF